MFLVRFPPGKTPVHFPRKLFDADFNVVTTIRDPGANIENTPIFDPRVANIIATSSRTQFERQLQWIQRPENRNPSLQVRSSFLIWNVPR